MIVLSIHDGLISPLACYTHSLSSLPNVELPLSSEDPNVHSICAFVHLFSSCVLNLLLRVQTCASPCFAVIFLAHKFGKQRHRIGSSYVRH